MKKEKYFLEANLENGEAILDQFLQNGLIKDIPVVGTLIKFYKAATDFKDRMFMAKILRFLIELDSIPSEGKEKLAKKMSDDSEKSREVVEAILFNLDKITDLEKSEVMAKLFVAYINDQVEYSVFRRMIEAVNQSFIDDLKTFISQVDFSSKSQDSYLRYLVSSGLTEVVSAKNFDNAGELYFEVTELGYKFLESYKYSVELFKLTI